jgi:MFS transporter, OFA family, oxalate/formate antiporter
MQLALGAVYAWSVFLTPVIKLYHVTRAEGNLTFTLALVALGITAGFGGYFNNRFGPRAIASECGSYRWPDTDCKLRYDEKP